MFNKIPILPTIEKLPVITGICWKTENDGLAPPGSENLSSIQPVWGELENKQAYCPNIQVLRGRKQQDSLYLIFVVLRAENHLQIFISNMKHFRPARCSRNVGHHCVCRVTHWLSKFNAWLLFVVKLVQYAHTHTHTQL